MTKRFSIVVAILFVLLITIGVVSAITGAMGNARMILYPEVNGITFTEIEKSILVKNVNDVPINITLRIDEEGQKFIELIDETFILEPNTEDNAEFIVKVKDEGTYKTKINVFFSPADGDTKTGVVLSSEVIVVAKKDQGNAGTNDVSDEDETEETGDIVSTQSEERISRSLGIGLLIGSVFILALILIILVVILSKKGGRRRKLNARRR